MKNRNIVFFMAIVSISSHFQATFVNDFLKQKRNISTLRDEYEKCHNLTTGFQECAQEVLRRTKQRQETTANLFAAATLASPAALIVQEFLIHTNYVAAGALLSIIAGPCFAAPTILLDDIIELSHLQKTIEHDVSRVQSTK